MMPEVQFKENELEISKWYDQLESQEAQSWQTFTFGTWNVRSLSNKKTDVIAEIERENEDIVVLTETKLRRVGRETLCNYVHLFSGVTYKGGVPSAGVSILVKKELSRNLEWERVSERIMWVKLNICNCEVVVIGVYWVDDCRSTDIKNKFQSELKSVISNFTDNCELIIMGDFNAWVGTEVNNAVVGEFGVEDLNNNGRRLKTLCSELNLKIQNTFFKHRDIHKYTWYGSGSKKSLVDYCITRQDSKLEVQDVVACRWLECGTDHVFIEATISFPFIFESQQCPSEIEIPEMPKYKTYLLFSKYFRASFNEYLDSLIDVSKNGTTEEIYQHLKESIHTAAKCILGFVNEHTFGEFFWDEEIRELRWLRKYRGTDVAGTFVDYNVGSGIKNEIWEGICADVNSKGKNKKYRAVRSILEELLNASCDKPATISMDSLERFFKKRFTETRTKFIKSTSIEEFEVDKFYPISVTDLEIALDDLEYCNYPAPGGISVKFLKYSSTKTKILLRNLIQRIFNGENIPEEIREQYIYIMSNVKNRSKLVSESTVQVMHPIMDIMGSLLKRTLENIPSFKEVPCETQLDVTFILRLLLQKYATKQEELVHFVTIDMADTYASVPHVKLFEMLQKAEVSNNLIRLIKRFTEGNSVRVIRGNEYSEEFYVNKGIGNICGLAPLLYKIYINEALKAWREEIGSQGLRIGNHNLSSLYSDDKLVVFANHKQDLEAMVRKLQEHFKGIGLRITPKLICYMGNEDLRLGNQIIGGESIIDYQGSILEQTGICDIDITTRVLEIKKIIGLLHPCARDQTISDRNKRRIFNSVVRSLLTYGCETWTVTESLKKQIDAAELRYWKWCCEKGTKKLTSSKIYELMNVDQKVSNIVMLKKAAWYTKVKELSNDHWSKLILEWEPEGKRKFRRPRAKWTDGVEDFMTTVGRHLIKNKRLKNPAFENARDDTLSVT